MKSIIMNPNITAKQYSDYIEKKWGKFMEDSEGYPKFKSHIDAKSLGLLLENVDNFYRSSLALNDAITVTTSNSNVNTSTGVVLPRILLPIIRRLFPSLMIRELVHTQVMNVPDSKIFFKNPMVGDPAVRMDDPANFNKDASKGIAEGGTITNSVSIQMAEALVSAVSSKLIASFTREQIQDYAAYGLGSIEPELVELAVSEIALELEGTMIDDMLSNVTNNVDWDATDANVNDLTTADLEYYNKTILNAIEDAALLVKQRVYVAPNWLLVSNKTASRLRKLQDFEILQTNNNGSMSLGVRQIGVLNGTYKVYETSNMFMPTDTTDATNYKDKILLGFKDNDLSRYRGYVFAPYIMAYLSDTHENPTTLVNSFGFMSRNGYKMLQPEMYATVTIQHT